MKFLVRGVNRDNGKKILPFVVTADSEDEALAIAVERGVLVTSVNHYHPPPKPQLPPALRPLPKQRGKYPALEILSEWYVFIAVLNAIGAAILCLYSLMNEQFRIFFGAAVYGVISTLTMFAFSQGSRLAIDVESHLRAIRRRSEPDE